MLEFAHSASLERGWVDFSPRSKRSTLNTFSVVKEWNVVCEEVCRAGFGGPGCGDDCITYNSLGAHIDQIRFRNLCPNLCENYLGITKCDCTSSFVNPNTTAAKNSLCSATCSWRHQLNGCSICVKDGLDGDDTTHDYGTTYTTDENASTTEEYSTDEEDKTTDEHSTTDSNESDTTSEEQSTDFTEDDSTLTTDEPTTTASTTTTTQATTTTTRATTTQPTTTTPNWESLCEALCRNGEGGSLCNCDIPPFF